MQSLALSLPLSGALSGSLLDHPMGGWSPVQIPGVTNGWDFSKVVGSEGDPIAQVDPIVGSVPLVQASASAKPTLTAGVNSINGKLSGYFTFDDFMSGDAVGSSVFSGTDRPFTIFGVMRKQDTTSADTVLSVGRSTLSTPFLDLGNVASPYRYRHRRTNDAGGTAAPTTAGGDATSGENMSFVLSYDGTSAVLTKGSVLAQIINASVAAAAGALTVDRFTLGCLRRTGTAAFGTVTWGEIYVTPQAITDTPTLAQWAAYCTSKWGTP